MTNPNTTQHTILAIGIGPFNAGLAALAHPHPDVRVIGIDQSPEFCWHPGMMLPEATIQVPFLADLVTFADPASPFSFLNYLKSRGQLYGFYIRESFFPYRKEYSDYCQWVVGQLPDLIWSTRVTQVTYDQTSDLYTAHCEGPDGDFEVTGSHVVVGTGTAAALPEHWPANDRVIHTAHYMDQRPTIQASDHVIVTGSGQSAAEVYLDLLTNASETHVDWITRSSRFHPMDVTKLTLEMTSPDYMDYFHELPAHQQAELNHDELRLYKGASAAILEAIHEQLYVRKVHGHPIGKIVTNTSVQDVFVNDPNQVGLQLKHNITGQKWTESCDFVICGTGYQHPTLDILDPITDQLHTEQGTPIADRWFALDTTGQRVFSQNTAAARHGLTTPDLGMGAYRNSVILNTITGREVYQVEKSIAHQHFGGYPQ